MIDKKFTFKDFLKRYPNDEACLREIYENRYPQGVTCKGCQRVTRYYPLKGRTTFSCGFCATQLSPLTDTIFEHSAVSLKLWFYAMFLMTKTKSGISAKQLERELGVSYKTAHRMFKQIRKLMQEEPTLLDGNVEVDETFVGGKGKNRATKPNFNEIPKEVVWGAVQRGGRVYAKHVANTGKWTLLEQIHKNIDKNATIMTDNYAGYQQLSKYGYHHFAVNHGASEYVRGEIHTNTIEGVWSQFKRGIIGVYRHVSKEYLQSYVNEYSFRYNYRNLGDGMFDLLVNRVMDVKPA
ncbi:MAG: IS1595 family transposase [Patescibacteria group bacterium]|nr:IS1595 family transposase [Patescibacteria group bacterium]